MCRALRIWIVSVLCVLGCTTVPAVVQESPATGQRPNFVVVLVDDMRWDDLGAAGHPFVQTPNIDRLANEGARFANAFAATPLCSPSRANFLTGLYAHANGIIDNTERGPASHELPTFPRALQGAGYETAFVGKWHMGNDDTPRPGFDYWLSFKGQGALFDTELNEDGRREVVEGYITDILNERAVAFVERQRDRPFLLYLAHKAIHPGRGRNGENGFLAAPRHQGAYAEASVPRRANYGVTPTDKPALLRPIDGVAPIGPESVTPDEDIRTRLEMLVAIDEGLGQLLDVLERAGQLNNTVVVLAGDHGYFYGEHGLNAERRFAYEESARLPLVMRYPEVIRAGIAPEQLVLNVDLAPTVLELAGVEPDLRLHGRSLVPLLSGDTPPDWRSSILIEHHSDPENYLGGSTLRRALNMGYRAVRTTRYKYIEYTDLEGMDELYDLEADPFELQNLIGRPGSEAFVEELREELRRLLEETS